VAQRAREEGIATGGNHDDDLLRSIATSTTANLGVLANHLLVAKAEAAAARAAAVRAAATRVRAVAAGRRYRSVRRVDVRDEVVA
jgi:hypothetical protein